MLLLFVDSVKFNGKNIDCSTTVTVCFFCYDFFFFAHLPFIARTNTHFSINSNNIERKKQVANVTEFIFIERNMTFTPKKKMWENKIYIEKLQLFFFASSGVHNLKKKKRKKVLSMEVESGVVRAPYLSFYLTHKMLLLLLHREVFFSYVIDFRFNISMLQNSFYCA